MFFIKGCVTKIITLQHLLNENNLNEVKEKGKWTKKIENRAVTKLPKYKYIVTNNIVSEETDSDIIPDSDNTPTSSDDSIILGPKPNLSENPEDFHA